MRETREVPLEVRALLLEVEGGGVERLGLVHEQLDSLAPLQHLLCERASCHEERQQALQHEDDTDISTPTGDTSTRFTIGKMRRRTDVLDHDGGDLVELPLHRPDLVRARVVREVVLPGIRVSQDTKRETLRYNKSTHIHT